MAELSLSVPTYDASIGVVAPTEGGTIKVEVANGSVEIFGDPAGRGYGDFRRLESS